MYGSMEHRHLLTSFFILAALIVVLLITGCLNNRIDIVSLHEIAEYKPSPGNLESLQLFYQGELLELTNEDNLADWEYKLSRSSFSNAEMTTVDYTETEIPAGFVYSFRALYTDKKIAVTVVNDTTYPQVEYRITTDDMEEDHTYITVLGTPSKELNEIRNIVKMLKSDDDGVNEPTE